MAARIDAAGDYFSRVTSLPNVDPVTVMFWMYITTDRNAIGFLYVISNGTASQYDRVLLASDGTTLSLTTQLGGVNGTGLSATTWYHIAYTRSGSTHLLYLNGNLDITVTQANTVTPAAVVMGSSSISWLNGRLAAIKIWNAALIQAEIQAEQWFVAPQRMANLYDYYPVRAGTRPIGFYAGLNWTENGALTDEDDPPGLAWGVPVNPHRQPENVLLRM